jgi:hypothetical protein
MILAVGNLVWPELKSNDFMLLLKIIGVSIVVGFVVTLWKKRVKKINENWRNILKFAYSQHLNAGEINLLEDFFQNAHLSYFEISNLQKEPKLFKSELIKYFSKKHDGNEEHLVQIVDKLFPMEIANQKEIKSIDDIIIGEPCSIEFEEDFLLGTITKKSKNELLVSFHERLPEKNSEGKTIQLYFFRLQTGGYLLDGKAKKIKSKNLIFEFLGEINWKGDLHLMAELKRSIKISPNELDIDERQKEDKELLEDLELDKDLAEMIVNPTEINGFTTKISDRASLIQFTDIVSPLFLKNHDIWNMELDLGTNTIVEVKGRLFPSKSSPSKYLFKYVNIDPEQRRAIFNEIKKFNPTQEQIS